MTPRSSQNKVVAGDPVKVYVTAPPAEGQANKAVVEALAKALGVPKSRVSVVRGATARDKTVEVQGLAPEELATALAKLG